MERAVRKGDLLALPVPRFISMPAQDSHDRLTALIASLELARRRPRLVTDPPTGGLSGGPEAVADSHAASLRQQSVDAIPGNAHQAMLAVGVIEASNPTTPRDSHRSDQRRGSRYRAICDQWPLSQLDRGQTLAELIASATRRDALTMFETDRARRCRSACSVATRSLGVSCGGRQAR